MKKFEYIFPPILGIIFIVYVTTVGIMSANREFKEFKFPLESIVKKGDVVYTQYNGVDRMKVFINVKNEFQIYEGKKIGNKYLFKINSSKEKAWTTLSDGSLWKCDSLKI